MLAFSMMRLVLVTATLALCGCADGETVSLVDELLTTPLPTNLSETGIYEVTASRVVSDPRVVRYEPSYQLWSDGSEKERFLVSPAAARQTGNRFDFEPGTLFVKTFAYDTGDGVGRPVETRLIRLHEDEPEYAVYRWSADGRDAELIDISQSVAVPVETVDGPATHTIPSRRDCESCHESNDDGVIVGFDVFLLSANGERERLVTEGWVDETEPALPQELRPPLEETVVGYLQANCAYCHNGLVGGNRAFDLRPEVAVANLVGRSTEASGATPGIRVAAGDPEASVAYQSVARTISDVMPPLGVSRADESFLATFREWIVTLR